MVRDIGMAVTGAVGLIITTIITIIILIMRGEV
jgi:hypothetical protein